MNVLTSNLPLYACLASLAAVPLILVSGARPNLREFWTLLAGVAKLGIVLFMLPKVLAGNIIHTTLWADILPHGLALEFRVDGLGILFALVASGLWIITSIYSMGYMRGLKEHSQTRFFVFFAISLSATLGVAFAGNLFTLYLFYEMLSLATYPLVVHHQDKEARGGGRTYLTYLLGTSVAFLLPALIYIYLQTGSMTFNSQGFLAGHIDPSWALLLFLMLIFGFAKGGLMPFHSWLPGAMVAPTPVSALLHAVAVVKVGVFCIVRVVISVFGVSYLKELDLGIVLSYIAAFTVIVSSLIAMSQDSLKRRLAFSTIGQLSYIILGVSLLNNAGVTGGILHIATHALGKITLFACAGAIFVATGKKYVHQLNGIGRQMPITMGCFCIGALSVTGIPPTAGFYSKWYMLYGTLEANHISLLIVFLISTILNGFYLIQPVFRAFFVPPEFNRSETHYREAPIPCLIPIVATSTLTLLLFFQPQILIALANLMT